MNANTLAIGGPVLVAILIIGGAKATIAMSPPAAATTADPSGFSIAAPVMPTTPAFSASDFLPTPTPFIPTVTYTIDGSGTAMVTYLVGSGFSEEQHTVTLPWSVTLTGGDQIPQTPIIGAQHQSGSGAIGCTVTRQRSTVVAHAQSTGAYAVVQCTPPFGQ